MFINLFGLYQRLIDIDICALAALCWRHGRSDQPAAPGAGGLPAGRHPHRTRGSGPAGRGQDAGLTISRTTFSHHQKVLREAGIILARVRGTERILSLRRDDLDKRYPGLLDAILNAPADQPG